MIKEQTLITYNLSEDDVTEAIEMWLTQTMRQDISSVKKVTPEYRKESYYIGNAESHYREVFDGMKVVCC